MHSAGGAAPTALLLGTGEPLAASWCLCGRQRVFLRTRVRKRKHEAQKQRSRRRKPEDRDSRDLQGACDIKLVCRDWREASGAYGPAWRNVSFGRSRARQVLHELAGFGGPSGVTSRVAEVGEKGVQVARRRRSVFTRAAASGGDIRIKSIEGVLASDPCAL